MKTNGFGIGAVAACALLSFAGGADAALKSKPGAYEVSEQRIETGSRSLHVTYVKPVQPHRPEYFVVFATGDGGWRGTSSEVFQKLAEHGYAIAGFNAPELIKPAKNARERLGPAQAEEQLADVYSQARQGLGLAATTPMIVVGFSRGATVVAFTALTPALRDSVAGAIAIALTREVDYLRAPDPATRRPEVQVDDKGRIQIYPALKLLGSARLAVIQSTHDPYVPSAESRQLLGPDLPTRRLYEVEAKNHRFGGGQEAMLHDVDDALRWIEQPAEADGVAR